MEVSAADPLAISPFELFTHIRIIIGMILGLSVGRLVSGLTRFIQHSGRETIYLPHLGWSLFLFLFIINFWWFEFALARRTSWSFGVYFFLVCYAGMFVALASVLFPDDTREYGDLGQYFRARCGSFFLLLLGLLAVDVLDTVLKGHDHVVALGWKYPARQVVLMITIILAMRLRGERWQLGLVTFALMVLILWIGRLF